MNLALALAAYKQAGRPTTIQFRIDRYPDHNPPAVDAKPVFPVCLWIYYPSKLRCSAGKRLYEAVWESGNETRVAAGLQPCLACTYEVCECMGEVIE